MDAHARRALLRAEGAVERRLSPAAAVDDEHVVARLDGDGAVTGGVEQRAAPLVDHVHLREGRG